MRDQKNRLLPREISLVSAILARFALELVSRFERNSRLSALESAAILGGRAVSIPVEPIFNGFITPALSIEFLLLSKASFRARALARVCLCAFACRFF